MNHPSGEVAVHNPAEPVMTPLKGLTVLAAIVVVVSGFIALNFAFGIHEFWAGFLFLLYWAGIEHMRFDKLPGCIVGSLFGLLLAWLLFMLPAWFGEAGGLIFLGIVLVVVYCQIMGWLTLAINMMTMLFLTVGTIPVIQSGANFIGMLIVLLLAFAYFIGLLWIGNLFRQKKPDPSAAV